MKSIWLVLAAALLNIWGCGGDIEHDGGIAVGNPMAAGSYVAEYNSKLGYRLHYDSRLVFTEVHDSAVRLSSEKLDGPHHSKLQIEVLQPELDFAKREDLERHIKADEPCPTAITEEQALGQSIVKKCRQETSEGFSELRYQLTSNGKMIKATIHSNKESQAVSLLAEALASLKFKRSLPTIQSFEIGKRADTDVELNLTVKNVSYSEYYSGRIYLRKLNDPLDTPATENYLNILTGDHLPLLVARAYSLPTTEEYLIEGIDIEIQQYGKLELRLNGKDHYQVREILYSKNRDKDIVSEFRDTEFPAIEIEGKR